MCGEARWRLWLLARVRGLSPRVRGSPGFGRGGGQGSGSIPACAGKPKATRNTGVAVRVYPRVCGEASFLGCSTLPKYGLSPRVRGSLRAALARFGVHGSIPACAGKPPDDLGLTGSTGVYPRVCGEACAGRVVPRLVKGSIPACAGKPVRSPSRRDRWGVYPRVCGEALEQLRFEPVFQGLSPRVRGSPDEWIVDIALVGSIPACAGKPGLHARYRRGHGVYPRVCGEAFLGSSSN